MGSLLKVVEAEDSNAAPVKAKRKRDPDEPKKPVSAYNFFMRHLQKHPDSYLPIGNEDNSTGFKFIGQRWKRLTAEERQPFKRMAERDRVRFESESMSYEVRKSLRELIDEYVFQV